MSTRDLTSVKHHILICNGGTCMGHGGEDLTQAIRDEIARHDARDRIHTTRTRCNGRCDDACVAIVYPEGTWYRCVTPAMGRELVRACLHEDVMFDGMSHHFSKKHGFIASRLFD